jgi:hypothetical protein
MSKSLLFLLSQPIYVLSSKFRMGTVNLAILASTNPGVANGIHAQLSESPPDKLEKRGLFGAIHKALEKAVDAVKDGVQDAANKVKDGVQDGIDGACISCSQWCYFLTVHLGLENHTGFNADHNVNFSLINLDKDGTVFKQAWACPPLTLGIDIDMDLQGSAHAEVSVAISGTLVPPTFSEFKIIPCM